MLKPPTPLLSKLKMTKCTPMGIRNVRGMGACSGTVRGLSYQQAVYTVPDLGSERCSLGVSLVVDKLVGCTRV